MNRVTIKVPATSANLGPGFDSVGCAWNIFNEFSFTLGDNGLVIDGCDKEFQNENNLCIVAYNAVLDKLNLQHDNLHLTIKAEVPVARGLGSSSTLISAGAFAANCLHGSPLSTDELFCICNKIEGHPDNLAPAIFGGLTVSIQENGVPYTVGYDINDGICFYALIPDFELSTEKAREVLPKSVDFKDAVFNLSRVAVLLKSLENGDIDMIKLSLSDKLHQPYRFQLIDEYEKVKAIVDGIQKSSVCISGAGSTLLVISDDRDFKLKTESQFSSLKNKWQVIELSVNKTGIQIIK